MVFLAAAASVAAVALPAVCLLYADANGNGAFGLFDAGNRTTTELIELDWAGLPEGIDATGVVGGQRRWFYNVGIGSGPKVKDVSAVLSWVPQLNHMTVTYASLPRAMPSYASRYAGSVAYANVAFDPAGAALGAPLAGIMQAGSGAYVWLAAGSWDPLQGRIVSVDGNFTPDWATDVGYKYGCSAFDPATRSLFQCIITSGADDIEAIQAFTVPLPQPGGANAYTPLKPLSTVPLPSASMDVLSVVFSPQLNTTVLVTSPPTGQRRAGAGRGGALAANASSSILVYDAGAGAYRTVFTWDSSSVVASTLGGAALAADGQVLTVLLNDPQCQATAGCAVLSWVNVTAGVELARLPLADPTTIVADVQECAEVRPPR